MKKLIILFLVSFMGLAVHAQSFDEAIAQMQKTIVSGDYTGLSNLFSDSVDLTVLETDGIFSKTQAKGVLKSFFEKEKPSSFQIKHKGSSNDGTVYAIGLLVSNAHSYRVYALFKSKQGKAQIVQFQVEKESE